MISFDTNIAVYAANSASSMHRAAVGFLEPIATRRDVAVCELMLLELYQLAHATTYQAAKSMWHPEHPSK